MSNITLEEIVGLPVEKRLQIADAIWDSISTTPDAVPLTEAQRAELDRRLNTYRDDPDAGDDWEMVLKRVREREGPFASGSVPRQKQILRTHSRSCAPIPTGDVASSRDGDASVQ